MNRAHVTSQCAAFCLSAECHNEELLLRQRMLAMC